MSDASKSFFVVMWLFLLKPCGVIMWEVYNETNDIQFSTCTGHHLFDDRWGGWHHSSRNTCHHSIIQNKYMFPRSLMSLNFF